ncbi:ACP S-malonyltransferase [Nitriliruptor alkaliphilus]|uniref:ACP S-malonyltransferase n=1 Tax=Nitriliruptor alkaliphilus TaxID=427918 RepID=UPI000696E12C|nr:ACP S-malonyltransferase [Nitriliruptor alkaliphilus]
MVRVAWVHPGQGSLRTGCLEQATQTDGRTELEPLAVAAGRAIDRVARATGRDLRALATDPATGSRTADAQPTILAASLAAAAALEAAGLRPDVVAGHSLGECTAAIVARCLEVDAGARVVAARGAAMADACRAHPGAMAALVKLAPEAVEGLLADQPDLVVANDNAPGQVVVAGPPDAVAGLRDAARAAGGRLVPLEVEGAFHSEAMSPAVPALADALGGVPVGDPEVPLFSGVGARGLSTGSAVADALLGGVLATVRWREVQLALAADGVTHLVEVGPGGVLAGLAKRTVPDLEVRTIATPADAHALAVELGVVAMAR